jgi:hypothetical protein
MFGPRHAWLLGATLLACNGSSGEGDEASSGADASTTGGGTLTPTTTGQDASSSEGGGTSGDAETTTGSTSEPLPEPLPPLAGPVVMSDVKRREPTHAVDDEKLLDMRVPEDVEQALADGYGDVALVDGEPVLPQTLDGLDPPAPGASPKLLARFVHLADTQLSDDESPARLVDFDHIQSGAFRPEEAYLCRMLNATVRTINRLHVDLPLDFVLLGGDNTDNAQTNELEWFLGILGGAPVVECDSADDNDPVPGPDNDPKDRFAPVGLDVPWRWVTGNHDILRQGTWPVADWMGEPIGTTATGGTRDWSLPGGPIVNGKVLADPLRRFHSEAEMIQRISESGDGNGIDAEALALGEAYYTFDVEGTPLRIFVLNTSAATGGSKGLIRQAEIDETIEPILQKAADDDKLVIITSHHRADSLSNGSEIGIGMAYDDALTSAEWVDYVGTHPHVILHLAAHSHTMHVQPRTPMGGHAYWDMASPAMSDFPSAVRLVEVYDQDNGFLTIRSVAFDFSTEDDPLAADGQTRAVADYTSFWTGDGRGADPEDRNVELWIAKP